MISQMLEMIKTIGTKTIKAGEALGEALCFGWIDGHMKSIDDTMLAEGPHICTAGRQKWAEYSTEQIDFTTVVTHFETVFINTT